MVHGMMIIQKISSGMRRKAIRKKAERATNSVMTAIALTLVIFKDLPDVALLVLMLLLLADLLELLALDDGAY